MLATYEEADPAEELDASLDRASSLSSALAHLEQNGAGSARTPCRSGVVTKRWSKVQSTLHSVSQSLNWERLWTLASRTSRCT